MKHILTLDVGNSNYQCIVYNETMKILFDQRHQSIRDKDLLPNYFTNIKNNLFCDVDLVVISCVIPSMKESLLEISKEIFDCEVINCDLHHFDLKVKLDNPDELGADFIASAIGVLHKYPQPTLVIDMGTANKVSLIDEKPDRLIGGIISPGIGQQFNSYKEILSHLPGAEIQVPKQVVGTNTIECIQSGITYGTLYGLFGICDQMEKEINQSCTRVITGGYSNLYHHFDNAIHDKTLVNDGLYYLGLNYLK